MSVPPNLNPDNISLREMSTAERFMIMFGQPIPRCEWTFGKFGERSSTCDLGSMDMPLGRRNFCHNCGSRIKFITK